jgi:Winged helix-turn helix
VVSVGRWLKTLGTSPQKPLYRAWQADPEAVATWKREEYPKIAAEAKKTGATVYFADEASVRSDYYAGTTWAPVGQTQVMATLRNLAISLLRFSLDPPTRYSRGGRCDSDPVVAVGA